MRKFEFFNTIRRERSTLPAMRLRISFPAYEPDYRLDRHLFVLVASFGAGQVDVEDFPESIFVRHAKETERADRHVNVDGVEVVAKSACHSTSLQDILDYFYNTMIDLPDLIRV